jgi:hypothetical protein
MDASLLVQRIRHRFSTSMHYIKSQNRVLALVFFLLERSSFPVERYTFPHHNMKWQQDNTKWWKDITGYLSDHTWLLPSPLKAARVKRTLFISRILGLVRRS